MTQRIEYAVYRGETFLDIGTLEELSLRLNITEKALKFYSYPCYHKRITENRLYTVKIEEEHNE